MYRYLLKGISVLTALSCLVRVASSDWGTFSVLIVVSVKGTVAGFPFPLLFSKGLSTEVVPASSVFASVLEVWLSEQGVLFKKLTKFNNQPYKNQHLSKVLNLITEIQWWTNSETLILNFKLIMMVKINKWILLKNVVPYLEDGETCLLICSHKFSNSWDVSKSLFNQQNKRK